MSERPQIRILSDHVANQIAAGEVIERPAAVVKELVENSLDAGATRVEVEFRSGGKAYIRVEDNGDGMTQDDALLALERHATSKIRTAGDLDHILSFGFRGEALPSIASISRFTLQTRTAQDAGGCEILINGGKMVHCREHGMPEGTRIEVSRLFSSIPARRKFLKTDNTEAAHIIHLVRLLAVANPSVAFTLLEDGRTIFRSPPCPSVFDRIREIHGKRVSDLLMPVDHKEGALHLRGYIGKPGVGRSSRQEMATFINRRPVDSRTFSFALVEAYHTYIPKGRYPLAFAFLDIPADGVDVNVHPAKREVRFRQEGLVRGFIVEGILNHLKAAARTEAKRHQQPEPQSGSGSKSKSGSGSGSETPAQGTSPQQSEAKRNDPVPPPSGQNRSSTPPPSVRPTVLNGKTSPPASAPAPTQSPAPTPESTPEPTPERATESKKAPDRATSLPTAKPTQPHASSAGKSAVRPVPLPPPTGRVNWRYLGTANGLHSIFETKDGVVLLHRQASRERILYEEILALAESGDRVSQQLLFPANLELDPVDAACLGDHLAFFTVNGFAIEHFGRNFYRIEAVPLWTNHDVAEAFIRDCISQIRDKRLDPNRRDVAMKTFARMAARRFGRNPDAITHDDGLPLAQRLMACNQPLTCPDGKPTLHELTGNDLGRIFGR